MSGESAAGMGIGTVSKERTIQVTDKNDESGIQLFIDKNGGITIYNKGKQNVLQAGVNIGGGGTIVTKDKHGYNTGRFP